jgi:hypothetical protein
MTEGEFSMVVEDLIDRATLELHVHERPDDRRTAMAVLRWLHKQRTKEQVQRMEARFMAGGR